MNKFTQLLIGTVIFIGLFFNQEPGMNVAIFALAVWLLSYLQHPQNAKKRRFRLLSATCWLSSLSFAWYGDPLSFAALFFSIMITVFYIQYPRLKTLLLPLIAVINFISFPFRVFYFRHWLAAFKGREHWQKWIAMGVIPLLFLILFASVYATGSDILARFFFHLFDRPDFMQILLLGMLGFFILFNIWVLWIPRLVIKLNTVLRDDFNSAKKQSSLHLPSLFNRTLQRKSGEVTLALLSVLLLIFIVTYNYEQFFDNANTGKLSEELHQRVTTVIGSIALAIGLIIYYFGSRAQLPDEDRLLKKSAFIWIVLNALLVISAFIKNGEYVTNYGLTFKRISVFIFLVLCLLGLYLTWYKIARRKTNFFLINNMLWIFYFTLVITAPLNFSWIVTRYNIGTGKNDDAPYLKSLDYNKNILYHYYKDAPQWKAYFDAEKDDLLPLQKKPLLSAALYFKVVKFN